MKILNAAIIGCGNIFSNHAEAISSLKSSRLYAVCDIEQEKVKEAANRYYCNLYTDYREMLNDRNIDIVHICTPHYLHAPMAIDAMLKDKHVLIEKPMSISVNEAIEMSSISKQTGKTIGVCFQNRYNTTSLRIKEVIQTGKVGKILGGKVIVTWNRQDNYYLESNWRGVRKKAGGGVLINQAIHSLDLMLWFMGEVDSLKASIDTRLLRDVIDVEDTADATITFKNGSTCVFYATNNYATDSPILIEIICENAVLTLKEKLEIRYSDGTTEEVGEIDKVTRNKAYWGCGHKYLIQDFYEKLQEKKPFELNDEQGIKTLKLIEAINRSSEVGSYVKL